MRSSPNSVGNANPPSGRLSLEEKLCIQTDAPFWPQFIILHAVDWLAVKTRIGCKLSVPFYGLFTDLAVHSGYKLPLMCLSHSVYLTIHASMFSV